MIYGNRFYAFNQPVKEAVEEVATVESTLTFESVLEGFDTVMALSKTNPELLESYCDLLENASFELEALDEGFKDKAKEVADKATKANLEYTKKFKENFKEYKDNFKAASQACKKKNGQDYKEAQKLYLKAADNAKNIIKDFDSIKSDTLESALLGDLIFVIVHALILALSMLIALIPGVGIALAIEIDANHLVGLAHEQINTYKNSIFKDKDSIDPKDSYKTWNLYKNKLESGAKYLQTTAQYMANACGKSAKIKAKEESEK